MSKEANKTQRALSLALEVLKNTRECDAVSHAIKALEEALAKQEQGSTTCDKPVAWTPRIERIYKDGVLVEQTIQYNPQGQKLPYPHEPSLPVGKVILYTGEGFACAPFHKIEWSDGMMPPVGTQLYTTPQQHKPLTDEQIEPMFKKRKDQETIGEKDAWYFYAWGVNDGEAAHNIKE